MPVLSRHCAAATLVPCISTDPLCHVVGSTGDLLGLASPAPAAAQPAAAAPQRSAKDDIMSLFGGSGAVQAGMAQPPMGMGQQMAMPQQPGMGHMQQQQQQQPFGMQQMGMQQMGMQQQAFGMQQQQQPYGMQQQPYGMQQQQQQQAFGMQQQPGVQQPFQVGIKRQSARRAASRSFPWQLLPSHQYV